MNTKTFLFVLCLSAVLGIGISRIKNQTTAPKIQSKYSHLGGDFELTSTKGKVRLKNFHDKTVVLFFGFTFCPDVCPLTLSRFQNLFQKLTPKQQKNLQLLFVSVDWKRDTPKTVHDYVTYFNSQFIGLTGSQDEIDKIVKSYGAYYEFTPLEDSELKYTVDHTSKAYLIKNTKIVATIDDSLEEKEVKALIERHL
ncbi:MAG: SCO family protein [Bacteriovoracaceae bacterium]